MGNEKREMSDGCECCSKSHGDCHQIQLPETPDPISSIVLWQGIVANDGAPE